MSIARQFTDMGFVPSPRSSLPPPVFSILLFYLALPSRLCFSKFHRQRERRSRVILHTCTHRHGPFFLRFRSPVLIPRSRSTGPFEDIEEQRRVGRGGPAVVACAAGNSGSWSPVTVTVLVALQNHVAAAARNRGLTVLQRITVL